jgi:hypothetical protein
MDRGVSIGAINSAFMAGNAPGPRCAMLQHPDWLKRPHLSGGIVTHGIGRNQQRR